MTKIVSVEELGHDRASRAIRQAEQEPVLVSKENRPAAWIVSAEQLAKVSISLGEESARIYHRVLALVAAEQYRQGVLSIEQAAKLAGLPLGDFIDLCSELRIPVLWNSAESLAPDETADTTRTGDEPPPPAPTDVP